MISPQSVQKSPNQFRERPQTDPAPAYRPPQNDSFSLETGNVQANLTHQFTINYVSDVDGTHYEGIFTTRKLSVKAQAQIGVRRSQLNGGYYYDEKNPGVGIDVGTHITNNIIAHLEFSLIQKPSWFDVDKIYDFGLLGVIFKNVIDFEQSFFRRGRSSDADPGSSQNDRGGKSEESGNTGHVKEVGRGEVQSALDA